MTWVQALATYMATRVAKPSTLAERAALYDQLARTHLLGLPGTSLTADGLAVLREARWEMLKDGTPHAKSALLERILRRLAQASEALPTGAVSTSCASQEGLSLLLEQVQCLVEAKGADIPLNARHFRHVLLSPHLSQLSPGLPLLLLEEMRQTNGPSPPARGKQHLETSREDSSAATRKDTAFNGTPDEGEAKRDCSIGLACAGHIRYALSLCPPQHFLYVVRRVAEMRPNDGWQLAWSMVEALPLSALAGASVEDRGWLDGAVEAARLRYQSTQDPSVKVWFDNIIKVNSTAARGIERLPKNFIETYILVCPRAAWADALGIVLQYNSSFSKNAGTAPNGDGQVPLGRMMALLSHASQPDAILKLFYGHSKHKQIVRCHATQCGECVESDALVNPTGEYVTNRDKRHAAVYNFAMQSWVDVGKWEQALRLYVDSPVRNVFTHIMLARLVLQQEREGTPRVPLTDTTYRVCLQAHSLAFEADTHVRDGEGLTELLALWAATRSDWVTAIRLADKVHPTCRYARLIAMAAALRAKQMNEAMQQYDLLCRSSKLSLKQLSLGLAFLSNSKPFMNTYGATEGNLREPLETLVLDCATSLVGYSQEKMDALIQLAVEYDASVRYHQTLPWKEDVTLAKEHILGSTVNLVRNSPGNDTSWKVLLQVFGGVAGRRGLSIAKAAPAMVSAGASGDVALHFLPNSD